MSAGVLALVRADWRSALTYRLRLVLSTAGLLTSVVPIYFVAGALQTTMAEAIRGEGGQYFGFLIVGMVAFTLISAAVNVLPGALASGIRTGTLEALLATRASLSTLLPGLAGYGLLRATVSGGLLLVAGWALGATVAWGRLIPALLLLGLVVAAHLPFGLLAGASVLAFRTSGPIGRIVLTVSGLLGGVYYPTHVVPSWLEHISAGLPLTYGLRALRRVLLEGEGWGGVAGDLQILLLFTVGFWLVAVVAFAGALRYARRTGILAQY